MLSDILIGMRRISHAIDGMFSITKWSITETFDEIIDCISTNNEYILELGAGRKKRQCTCNMLIISDIDYEALRKNMSSENRLTFNGNVCFPLKDRSIDIISSRFTFEHLQNTENAVSECARVLNKNGKMLILFSSRNADFSILNRMLPESIRKGISCLFPNKEGDKHGYRAYYDNCTLNNMKHIMEKYNLTVIHEYHHYYSATYFDFFPPLYFVMLLYEQILSVLDIHNLTSYVFIEASKY